MTSASTVAVVAGFAFVTLAMFVQGVLPALVPEARTPETSRAVRTDLGEVKWVRYPSAPYTPLERLGRDVYVREGCWYCHSQYVRPVAGEAFRWGPVAEAGEYAHDQPHLLGTRRIGPDLSRVGGKYADDWHYAHFWNARFTVPESIMPSFPWLFDAAEVPVRWEGATPRLEPVPALRRWFTPGAGAEVALAPDASGLAFVRPPPDGVFPIDGTPVLDPVLLGGPPPAGARRTTLRLLAPTRELIGLVAYLQRLGASRGAWRDGWAPQNVAVTGLSLPEAPELRDLGREVYEHHCAGCHGDRGDGAGPAATFLSPRPRDFTAGVFKFRSTPSGALPTDGDLYRTVTRGLRGTAMPTWHEVGDKERLAVVAHLKTFSPRWREQRAEPPIALGPPPAATPELLARGRALWVRAKCAECHGESGRGDGPAAGQLRDDWDAPIRPGDLTRGHLKGGTRVADVYRTMTTGLDGTPMPSYGDSMTDDERWAIAYYVLSLSAWTDPLAGERLRLSAAARAALNSSALVADRPALAWDPAGPAATARRAGRRHWPGIAE